jgi:uncharacterized protein with HEPN domain
MPRDYRVFLEDMREAGGKARRYVEALSFETFSSDEKTVDAVVRNLEILGEATKQVPDFVRSDHPQVDWYRIAGLRDILIHQYFGIDDEFNRQRRKSKIFEDGRPPARDDVVIH